MGTGGQGRALTVEEERCAWAEAQRAYRDCGGNARGAMLLLRQRFDDAGHEADTIPLLTQAAARQVRWLAAHPGQAPPAAPPATGPAHDDG